MREWAFRLLAAVAFSAPPVLSVLLLASLPPALGVWSVFVVGEFVVVDAGLRRRRA